MRPCAAARCGLRACALRLRFCTVIFDENALVSGAALWQYSALGWALRAEFFSRFPNFRTYTTCNANDSAPPKRERSKNGSSFTHYALRLYYNHEFTVQSSIEKYRVLLKSTTRSTRIHASSLTSLSSSGTSSFICSITRHRSGSVLLRATGAICCTSGAIFDGACSWA